MMTLFAESPEFRSEDDNVLSIISRQSSSQKKIEPVLTRTIKAKKTFFLDELHLLSKRDSKIQNDTMEELKKIDDEIKIHDNSKTKDEIRNTLKR